MQYPLVLLLVSLAAPALAGKADVLDANVECRPAPSGPRSSDDDS